MQRETKQHCVYAAVIVIMALGIILYDNYRISETEAMLSGKVSDLSSQLKDLEQTISGKISDLEQVDASLISDTSVISSDLETKGSKIESLTGELSDIREQSAEQISVLEQQVSNLQVEYEDFSGVIEDVLPAVVSVQTDVGLGSGFIIDKGLGYIVTNHHVIENARSGSVTTSDGRMHRVSVVGFDESADVAVLRINATGLEDLAWGDSNTVNVGQKVIAVGNPGGLQFSVTQGIISSTDRKDSRDNELLQIDVPINPGNSGGPLIDSEGNVIGVNTLKIAGFEGVGFALSSNYVEDIVDGLI